MPELIKNAPQELKWIEDEPNPSVAPDSSAYPPEQFELVGHKTFSEHVLRKAQDNVFVPLGLIATTACLTLGLLNFKRGDKQKQQLFMRGRIGFQAFTLFAMTAGMFLTSTKKRRSVK